MIGMMGAGKTSVGRRLAAALDLDGSAFAETRRHRIYQVQVFTVDVVNMDVLSKLTKNLVFRVDDTNAND